MPAISTVQRTATIEDIPAIVELADGFLLPALSQADREHHGFLVSNFTETVYRDFIARQAYFQVLENAGVIRAFLLAYDSDLIDADNRVDQAAKDFCQEPFVLIKQICVAPDAAGKGYGRRLYEWLRARTAHRAQAAAIVLEPRNQPSVVFHQRLGFTKALELVADDGRLRGIWFRAAGARS